MYLTMMIETNQFIDEPHHSTLLTIASSAEVPVCLQDCSAERDDVIFGDPSVERHCLGAAFGAEEAADENIETHAAVHCGGHVSKVVDVRVFV